MNGSWTIIKEFEQLALIFPRIAKTFPWRKFYWDITWSLCKEWIFTCGSIQCRLHLMPKNDSCSNIIMSSSSLHVSLASTNSWKKLFGTLSSMTDHNTINRSFTSCNYKSMISTNIPPLRKFTKIRSPPRTSYQNKIFAEDIFLHHTTSN